jgi:glutamine amidotransferase
VQLLDAYKSIIQAFYHAGISEKIHVQLEWINVEDIAEVQEKIKTVDAILVPGGFGERGIDGKLEAIRYARHHNLPFLGICLGMQLMCNYCEEGNTQGLGIFDVDVVKFSNKVKVPQIGWNQIENLNSELFKGIAEKEYMYLVHSFYVPLNEEAIAITEYGIKYASALQKDNFYGVQFHPEKSSKAGEQILKNFLEI